MLKNYKDLYRKHIGDKFNKIIISYEPQSGEYTYKGFSHHVEPNALDRISDIIIDDLIFYAFTEDEILKKNQNTNILDDLRTAAKYAYIQRLPKRENAKTDGTIGEVLLDIFLQLESDNTQKLIARAKHTEINNKKEITGYDTLYFSKNNNEISLWLGQAKAGEKTYCKRSIIDDLQEKYKKEYFLNTAFYIADRRDTNELDGLLDGINEICKNAIINKWDIDKKFWALMKHLLENNVTIKIPCLLTYSKDIYNDEQNIKKYIDKEIYDIISEFDDKKFMIDLNLNYEIIFYILPVKDVDSIREKIVEFKKE